MFLWFLAACVFSYRYHRCSYMEFVARNEYMFPYLLPKSRHPYRPVMSPLLCWYVSAWCARELVWLTARLGLGRASRWRASHVVCSRSRHASPAATSVTSTRWTSARPTPSSSPAGSAPPRTCKSHPLPLPPWLLTASFIWAHAASPSSGKMEHPANFGTCDHLLIFVKSQIGAGLNIRPLTFWRLTRALLGLVRPLPSAGGGGGVAAPHLSRKPTDVGKKFKRQWKGLDEIFQIKFKNLTEVTCDVTGQVKHKMFDIFHLLPFLRKIPRINA